MAYDGWLRFDGVELVNLSRTADLSEARGVDVLYTTPESVEWIRAALGDSEYFDVYDAPWFDPRSDASAEFVGTVLLSAPGLDDSTASASTTELTSAGGRTGRSRNSSLSIVCSMAILATSARGADYGKRWVDSVLRRGAASGSVCRGVEMEYFRYEASDAEPVPPVAHRRMVRLSRGSTVTRKHTGACAHMWTVNFTLVADDPFEYGAEIPAITSMGGTTTTGPAVLDSGTVSLTETPCPEYDYTPVLDPTYPSFSPAPIAPDFPPAGWGIEGGMTFSRRWALLDVVAPASVNLVPKITIRSSAEARMVRVTIWPGLMDPSDQCGELFSAVVTYLPPNVDFIIDGEQSVAYTWDGSSPVVRRSDSLVYTNDARPVDWRTFNDPDGLLVTLDVFGGSGGGTVRVALDLVPKSD